MYVCSFMYIQLLLLVFLFRHCFLLSLLIIYFAFFLLLLFFSAFIIFLLYLLFSFLSTSYHYFFSLFILSTRFSFLSFSNLLFTCSSGLSAICILFFFSSSSLFGVFLSALLLSVYLSLFHFFFSSSISFIALFAANRLLWKVISPFQHLSFCNII